MSLNNEALQQQLIKDLLIESFDGLDRFDSEMLALEKGQAGPDAFNIIFRVIHTIKGTAGCIGLAKIEAVAHVGENLLCLLRDGRKTINPAMIAALLQYSDALKEMLRCLEQTGQEGEKDYSALLETLQKLQFAETPVAAAPTAEAVWGLFDEASPVATPATPATESTPPAPPAVTTHPVAHAPTAPEKSAPAESPQRAAGSVSDSAIRVDVGQLDKLMNLVGELVLARNQILQYTARSTEATLLNASQRLNLITTELQESVMKTRMQPIENVWSKFPRVVRDVSSELGKKVQLIMEGNETELDRTIIEAIKDPLTHIVRNSLDHGIEKPEKRIQAGKPAEGVLILRAFHEGGQVNIEIMDDGAGINLARVKQKAVEKGIVTAEAAGRMTNREGYNLIFLPGFSTAEKVTNVSGRGVGMDVVKTNIEKIGGSVDILSEAGQGTTLKIKIPLTLAIIPALIVLSGGERFAIPQVSLVELVRLEGQKARQGIESLYGSPVYRLRGQLLPLVYLKKILSGSASRGAGDDAQPGSMSELFARARAMHQGWLVKLRAVLDGRQPIPAADADAHRSCELGKSLYAGALKSYGALPEVKELETRHEQFHGLVSSIISLKTAGKNAEAEEAFHELGRTSGKIVKLLAAVEQQILENQSENIVVLQADGRQFGLIVDDIQDSEEIVVKPLGQQLKGIPCFAGATIMGDGKVALILDVPGVAQFAKIISAARETTRLNEVKNPERTGEKQSFLVFEIGQDSRLAVALSTVARLEEFPRRLIERSGGQEVVQYRGQILPLLKIENYLPTPPSEPVCQDPMQVVVYSEQGRSVGLVVGKISDIVTEAVTVKRNAQAAGIVGSAVIQDKVTDLLDVPAIIRAADPAFYASTQEQS
jgi:chemotaxis protein histidine kinase CheA